MVFRKVRDIGLVVVVFVLAVVVGVFMYFRSYYNREISTPNSDDSTLAEVLVEPGDSVQEITLKLINAGVVRSSKMPDGRYVFQWYLSFNQLGSSIAAGRFFVPKNLNMIELAEMLETPGSEDLWVQILEGYRIEEAAKAIDDVLNSESNKENSQFNKAQFITLAKTSRYEQYEFMSLIPENKPLEGFVFPDSYLVEKDVSTEEMLKLLLTTFDQKVYQKYKSEISNNKYTLYELVTIAAMVERESREGEERAMIADIMFRRLEARGWRLEIDATLQYGLGWSEDEQSWWRQNLPSRYTENEYNTSTQDGLPPTPICSPGESSFAAALRPQANKYWFYLHDNDGNVHFSETLSEHEQKRQEYL